MKEKNRVPLDEAHTVSIFQPKTCHRCRRNARRRGRISASVMRGSRVLRLYLCAACINDLSYQTREAA